MHFFGWDKQVFQQRMQDKASEVSKTKKANLNNGFHDFNTELFPELMRMFNR